VVEKKEIVQEPTDGEGRKRRVGDVDASNALEVGVLVEEVDRPFEVSGLNGDVIVKEKDEVNVVRKTVNSIVSLTGERRRPGIWNVDRLEGGDLRKPGLVLVQRPRITCIDDHEKTRGIRSVILNAGDRTRKRPGAISRANDCRAL
jgi:hypothetical protein